MREVFNTGANVTFSSDWTVNSINPLVAIANSVRLKNSKGLPDIQAAIQAATINGARALGLESVTGSIVIGKSADFVLLDRNIVKAKPKKIESTRVLMTILQGEKVFVH
jgi:predicted amidohydrolase YtcJ